MNKKRYKNRHQQVRVPWLQIASWVIRKIFSKTKTPQNDTVPVLFPDLEKITHPDPDVLQVTWVGHTTTLVQYKGVSFLTDPIWSEYPSPIQGIGPKRVTAPGIPLDKLPVIDFVLISHNHYDHLDYKTVMKLPADIRYVVPAGLQKWFEKIGRTNVVQYEWGDVSHQGITKVTCVSSQHWSNRGRNINATLWCGWVVEILDKKIYFLGDGGYSPEYKEIGDTYGPFDLSLIPIGAYAPRSLMKMQHIDPVQAVQVFRDTRTIYAVGVHWGTFKLTEEPVSEPPQLLRQELSKENLDQDSFRALSIGETWSLDGKKY